MVTLKYCGMITMLVVVLVSGGCRTNVPPFHMSDDIDFSVIQKVAVLPLQNFSGERNAEDVVRQLVITELLASGLVDVTVPGEASGTIEKMGIKEGSTLDAQQIKAIGNALKVQAVVIGSVDRFGEARTGTVSAPEVTVTLMMAETNAGTIAWSITKSRGGAGFLQRYFGARTDTMSETALKVVRDAIGTLTLQQK